MALFCVLRVYFITINNKTRETQYDCKTDCTQAFAKSIFWNDFTIHTIRESFSRGGFHQRKHVLVQTY